MIGSSTLIVRENRRYNLHRCDMWLAMGLGLDVEKHAAKHPTLFEHFVEMEAKWRAKRGFDGKTNVADVRAILRATSTREHAFAGDSVYLLDMTRGTVFAAWHTPWYEVRDGKPFRAFWYEETYDRLRARRQGIPRRAAVC